MLSNMTATEPITVTISHRLGRDGAKRRIDEGLASIRAEVAPYVKTLDYKWDDHRLDFRVVAMMQTITGRIEVYEDFVKVELALPRLLHLVAKTIAGRIENRAATLLEPPKGKG
jgi:Putative polyhydroxyalkanoic acid system protein (PHA_gran_rgn)